MFLITYHAQDQLAVSDRATQFGDAVSRLHVLLMATFAIWKRIFSACRLPVKNYGSFLAIGRPFRQEMTISASLARHDSGVLSDH